MRNRPSLRKRGMGARMRERRSAEGQTSVNRAQRNQHGVQHLLVSSADQPARPGAGLGVSSASAHPSPPAAIPLRLRPNASARGSTAVPALPRPAPPPEARPSCSSWRLGCSLSPVPLLLLLGPAVLTVSPSFPQRMSSFQLNLNPLKEPLGFIKVLEWVSAPVPARPRVVPRRLLPLRPGQCPRRGGGESRKRGRGPARAGLEVAVVPGRDGWAWRHARPWSGPA